MAEDTNTHSPQPDEKSPAPPPAPELPPVETRHTLALNGETLAYTATAGTLPLRDEEKDELKARIFFTAYTLDRPAEMPASARPLMFVFNGGPGSSSVWLHLGALGPRRVVMQDEGWMPPPPYRLEDNAHTWLDLADLVFIDPVGTGFSRPAKPDEGQQFWSLQGDLESVGEFIRLYLTRYGRWASPLFLAGESYGTTRAAGLAGHLVGKGIAFNGIILISTTLNFQTLEFEQGNDLPYALFLPTYAATAWYHGRLPEALQQQPLADVLAEVTAFAEGEYLVALAQGDRLDADQRRAVQDRLARYTGLDPRYLDGTHLRIEIMRFCKELLRDGKRTVGRLDSRFTGMDALAITERPEFDPSYTAIMPPYTAMMNDYVRGVLGYETDLEYQTLNGKVNEAWQWDQNRYADTSEALRSALTRNPFMKVFVAAGYYDLATPYAATYYTLSHMNIDPALRANVQAAEYEAGHMLYLDLKSLAKLRTDVQGFMAAALGEA
ncbi:MAG: peptidase S10 [Anaerolineae bacterium]|nr:peptidase S10 [Anaerolineae bacterium]